jgi:hypothetical protein
MIRDSAREICEWAGALDRIHEWVTILADPFCPIPEMERLREKAREARYEFEDLLNKIEETADFIAWTADGELEPEDATADPGVTS